MSNETFLIGKGDINGKEYYFFPRNGKGMIFFKAMFDGIEHLVKREEAFENTECRLNQGTLVKGNDAYVYPTKFTIKDQSTGVEKVLEDEELQEKITYIFGEQQKKHERLAEMESKLHLLSLTYEDERKMLLDYLLADESEEPVLYAEFMKELEYNLITMRYVVDKKGVVIYIQKSLLAKLKELQLKNLNLDEEEDHVTVKETTNEKTFETFRKICKFFDVKPEDIEEKINGMKEVMEMGR